jgi:adenine/guanine phosphoribosyltransferase-like PRPP-binding protein
MNQDKYVFSQLSTFLNRTQFNNYVRKYDGNRYVKHFTCWNQLLAMIFGQLSNRESLRDLIVALEAHQGKRYHLGLGRESIAKTTLASANQNRNYRIFEDFAFYMMKEACEKRATNILDIPGRKYAFDSTTIPLCLATFPWAKFRKRKAGVDRLLTIDLHAAQIQGFFDIPVDHLMGAPLIGDYFERRGMVGDGYVVVSPDHGGVTRARKLAQFLKTPIAIIDKRRSIDKMNTSEVMNIIGDVEGKTCILIDDMIDTAGTICHAADALAEAGATAVYASCTHPVLSGPAMDNISKSAIKKLVVLDTIEIAEDLVWVEI